MLGRIERAYGSVAEYNRCMEEAEEHEAELRARELEVYTKNNEKMRIAEEKGLDIVYFSDDCIGCEAYEDVGMLQEMDDVTHGICMRKGSCKNKKK